VSEDATRCEVRPRNRSTQRTRRVQRNAEGRQERGLMKKLMRANPIDLDERGVPPAWDDCTREILSSSLGMHTRLGPSLPERVYEAAHLVELRHRGFDVETQRQVTLTYRTVELPTMVLDLVINDLMIVELKSTESVHPSHLAQLVSYLRATSLPLGLLINFGLPHLKDGIYRKINPAAPQLQSFRSSLRSSALSASSAYSPASAEAPQSPHGA